MDTHNKEDFGMVDPEMLQSLDSQAWENIIPKLVYYALFRLKVAKWRGRKPNSGSDLRAEAEDLALEAIKLVYIGRRQWNPDAVPDILVYLKGVVNSLVSHLINSPDYKRRRDITLKPANGEEMPNPMELVPRPDPDPHDSLAGKEIESYLLNWAGHDETLQSILHCLFNGTKRADVAVELNIPLAILDNYMKRIRRALSKFLDNDNN